MPDDRILLRNYRIVRRKARIEIEGDVAVLVLPGYFGRHRWNVPLAGMAVVDLTTLDPDIEPGEEVFDEDVVIPYFFTTGPMTDATTLLLFVEPQRVPPVRFLVAIAPNSDLSFGYRQSRSAAGAHVDGVLLRADDPAAAAERLAAAGATRVLDPYQWLLDNREVVTDPVARRQLFDQQQSSVRLGRMSNGLLGASLFSLWFLNGRESVVPVAWGFPLLGGAIALVLRRMAKQPPPSD